MNFTTNKKNIRLNGQLFYLEDEHSFDYKPYTNADIVILVGFLNLGFDSETMRAKSVFGYSNSRGWKKINLDVPTYSSGELILNHYKSSVSGVSKRIRGSEKWETFYDEKKGWICIGNCEIISDVDSVEFLKDSVVVCKSGEIVSLWLKPTFIK